MWLKIFIIPCLFKAYQIVDGTCDYHFKIVDFKSHIIAPIFLDTGEVCKWSIEATPPNHVLLSCAEPDPAHEGTCFTVVNQPQGPMHYCGNSSIQEISYSNSISFMLRVGELSPPITIDCGYTMKKPKSAESIKHSFSMIAALLDAGDRYHCCVATIISTKSALTTAECIEKCSEQMFLITGSYTTANDREIESNNVYKVNSSTIHNQYDIYAKDNNIAIIFVEREIVFGPNVRRICSLFVQNFLHQSLYAIGWIFLKVGGLHTDHPNIHGRILKYNISVADPNTCKGFYGGPISSKQMCVSNPGNQICKMETGMPAFWNDTEGNLKLVGMFSYGACLPQDRGVLTKVGMYSSWIRKNVEGEICED